MRSGRRSPGTDELRRIRETRWSLNPGACHEATRRVWRARNRQDSNAKASPDRITLSTTAARGEVQGLINLGHRAGFDSQPPRGAAAWQPAQSCQLVKRLLKDAVSCCTVVPPYDTLVV